MYSIYKAFILEINPFRIVYKRTSNSLSKIFKSQKSNFIKSEKKINVGQQI